MINHSPYRRLYLAVAAFLIGGSASFVFAVPPPPKEAVDETGDPAVLSTVVAASAAKGNGSQTANYGDVIDVQVRGLGRWMASQPTAWPASKDVSGMMNALGKDSPLLLQKEPQPNFSASIIEAWKEEVREASLNLCLYVNGTPFPELKPFFAYWNRVDKAMPLDATGCPNLTLRFLFERPSASSLTKAQADDVTHRWNSLIHHIYSNTSGDNWQIGAKIDLTVGFDDANDLLTGKRLLSSALNPTYQNPNAPTSDELRETFRIRPVSPHGMEWAAGIICGLVLAISVFGFCTDLLRDPTLPLRPSLFSKGVAKVHPYSLAYCQIAFWTIIIVASYLFIYLSTQNYNCFNSTALTLLGISATTGVGAVIINTNNSNTRSIPWSFTMSTFYTRWRGVSFFTDLFCERETMSFHRLQLIAWTLILAVVLLHTVYNTLALPDFDPTLLILVGIVNGTYLGMKATST